MSQPNGRVNGRLDDRPDIGRLNLLLHSEVLDALRNLARRKSTTVTGLIRQAIELWLFVIDAQSAGGKLLLEDEKGNTRQMVLTSDLRSQHKVTAGSS
jgi:hypothetical protein